MACSRGSCLCLRPWISRMACSRLGALSGIGGWINSKRIGIECAVSLRKNARRGCTRCKKKGKGFGSICRRRGICQNKRKAVWCGISGLTCLSAIGFKLLMNYFQQKRIRDFLEWSWLRNWMKDWLRYVHWYWSVANSPEVFLSDFFSASVYEKEWGIRR